MKHFVKELMGRLSYPQRRALKVTWTRLSEAPKTSGRGNLQIMEKVKISNLILLKSLYIFCRYLISY